MRGSDVSPVIIVLSIICIILMAVFVSIFSRKFYKAWSHGAHGRPNISQSITFIFCPKWSCCLKGWLMDAFLLGVKQLPVGRSRHVRLVAVVVAS